MPEIDDRKLELEARLFAVIGQPTRLRLLYMLRGGEECLCRIAPAMKEDASVISRHLGKLRDLGLLESRKEGVSVYYRIADPAVFDLLERADDLLRTITQRRAAEAADVL